MRAIDEARRLGIREASLADDLNRSLSDISSGDPAWWHAPWS